MGKRKPNEYKFTLVQHSGYGYSGNPQFKKGLETRTLSTDSEIALVERAGGVVFNMSKDAEAAAEKWMYPQDTGGLIPQAIGTFSDKCIDGLAIYVPVRKVIG